MKKLILIYNNKANYPELKAYQQYFSRYFEVTLLEKNNIMKNNYDNDTILWFLMGFYPERYSAGCIVHDYRSLSVGNFPRIKNLIKKYFNQKPDLRVFLNQTISNEINFTDEVPEYFIDMGVPKSIVKYSNSKEILYDFIYVGDISIERETHILIENFIKAYKFDKNLLLVGPFEENIYNKYSKYKNIFFRGRVAQEKVFELIAKSAVCINFIPNKYPYYFQTSTKLFEYASMGKKIISNKTDAIVKQTHRYKINSLIVDDYNFPSIEELPKIANNSNFNTESIFWENIIENSKIKNVLL